MRREVRVAAASLRRRPLLAFAGWSVPEALPAALSGLAVARAVDDGFLADRPTVGLAWLGGLVVAAALGALGARGSYRRLGDLVEPFRDRLARTVVAGALHRGVRGQSDDGAVARLSRQVEIVRDTYAGLLLVLRGFVVTLVGVVVGLLSVAPEMALLMLPPFLLGLAVFLATLGFAAGRYRRAVRADERLAAVSGAVLAGRRDLAARGAEGEGARMVAVRVGEQAAAERALAALQALRSVCFAIGGWGPLLVLLAAGPWLVDRGTTAGTLMGGLTYVLIGLQPALNSLITGLGNSGLRFVVTLGRILDAGPPEGAQAPAGAGAAPAGHEVALRGVTFAYGPASQPVVRDLDLTLAEGEHLAVVGPSGIGKSTLAGLVCGLLRPDVGEVRVGGVPAIDLEPSRAASLRVLIPQEAYVFSGSVRENLAYLAPDAGDAEIAAAAAAVGADGLLARLGGPGGRVEPEELSAGERQLLALARAYLSPAPLAVLDEATCHLDPAAERRAEEAFAARDGSLIVIAHRISSALRADRILVLDGAGAVSGDRETLLETSPLFRELLGHWSGAPADEPPARAGGLIAALRQVAGAMARLSRVGRNGGGSSRLTTSHRAD